MRSTTIVPTSLSLCHSCLQATVPTEIACQYSGNIERQFTLILFGVSLQTYAIYLACLYPPHEDKPIDYWINTPIAFFQNAENQSQGPCVCKHGTQNSSLARGSVEVDAHEGCHCAVPSRRHLSIAGMRQCERYVSILANLCFVDSNVV